MGFFHVLFSVCESEHFLSHLEYTSIVFPLAHSNAHQVSSKYMDIALKSGRPAKQNIRIQYPFPV